MSKVTEDLVKLLRLRAAVGLRKYGTTLDREDLTIEQWLDHKTEELLDAAGYAQAAKREIRKLRKENARITKLLLDHPFAAHLTRQHLAAKMKSLKTRG